MIFSIVLMLLVLLVAYFHYLQGFFSATLSTILVACSVLLAFSYYEPVIEMVKPGKFADSAHGMILLALFALSYLILRVIFDLVIKGNVRMPATFDKVGAGIAGLIAGILAVGTVAVAAQMLPFPASIAGYTRYDLLGTQPVGVQTTGRMEDRKIYDELKSYTISTTPDGKEAPHNAMSGLPIDDMVLGFIYHSSNGGSTAGAQPLAKIHPDLLQELFGNRIGIELGAKRSSQPFGADEVVALQGVYTIASIPQIDAEPTTIRKRGDEDKLDRVLKPAAGHLLLIVRLQFKLDATDADKITRVSCGSVRLVASTTDENGRQTYRDYYPLGTVDGGRMLMVNKPDDFLFLPPDKAADFLFVVDAPAVPDLKALPAQIPGDSEMFVEAKRYGRIPMAGKNIEAIAPSDQVAVMRKKQVLDTITNSDPDLLKTRLFGKWDAVENGTNVVFTFSKSGTWAGELNVNGTAMKVGGTWRALSASGSGLMIESSNAKGAPKKFLITFKDDNTATMADQGSKSVTTLTRKQ